MLRYRLGEKMEETRLSRRQEKQIHKRQGRRSKWIGLLMLILAMLLGTGAYYGYGLISSTTPDSQKQAVDKKKDVPAKDATTKTDKKKGDDTLPVPPKKDQVLNPGADGQVQVEDNSGFTGLTGKVINAESKNPIAGATVETSDKTVSVKTDDNGVYKLELKAGEAVAISVSAPAYFSAVAAGSVDDGQTKSIDFALRPQSGNQAPPSPIAF